MARCRSTWLSTCALLKGSDNHTPYCRQAVYMHITQWFPSWQKHTWWALIFSMLFTSFTFQTLYKKYLYVQRLLAILDVARMRLLQSHYQLQRLSNKVPLSPPHHIIYIHIERGVNVTVCSIHCIIWLLMHLLLEVLLLVHINHLHGKLRLLYEASRIGYIASVQHGLLHAVTIHHVITREHIGCATWLNGDVRCKCHVGIDGNIWWIFMWGRPPVAAMTAMAAVAVVMFVHVCHVVASRCFLGL